MSSDGFFRMNKGFTVVQNEVIKDKTLSLKAKGLYAVIQCHISIPNTSWRKSYFENSVTDGYKSFVTAWNELRDKGYLKIHNVYNQEIHRPIKEYELLAEPKGGPHTFNYDKEGNVKSTIGNVIVEEIKCDFSEGLLEDCLDEVMEDNLEGKKKVDLEEKFEDDSEEKIDVISESETPESPENRASLRHTQFGPVGNGPVGNGPVRNGLVQNGLVQNGPVRNGLIQNGVVNNNTDKRNNNINNKILNNTQINNTDSNKQYQNQDQIVKSERYSMEFLKKHYEADWIVENKDGSMLYIGQKDVDCVLNVIYDAVNSAAHEIWLKGQYWNKEVVISRLLKLTSEDIIYVIEKYRSKVGIIKNHKQYLLSLLYDASIQERLDMFNQATHDMNWIEMG
ncbi:MAG TPA: hypothetical protein DCW44_02205 [Eubacterium sp.]|nr:hypothetical protein [Eubacterium sp.]